MGGKEKPKFDKKKCKPTGIVVNTTTADAADPSALPPKVNKSVVNFDSKDIKFNPDAVHVSDRVSRLSTPTLTTNGNARGRA